MQFYYKHKSVHKSVKKKSLIKLCFSPKKMMEKVRKQKNASNNLFNRCNKSNFLGGTQFPKKITYIYIYISIVVPNRGKKYHKICHSADNEYNFLLRDMQKSTGLSSSVFFFFFLLWKIGNSEIFFPLSS